jgi:hypothetical protein
MDASKFIAYVPIGDAQPTATNPRGVNLPRAKDKIFDFNDLIEGPLYKLYQRGFRRFLLWQPFGLTLPPGCYSGNCTPPWKFTLNGVEVTNFKTALYVDDWVNLINLNYGPYWRMVNTFVPAIHRFKKELPAAEIIIYLGAAMGNPKFRSLNPAQIRERLDASLEPVFDTHCHVAFDSACALPPNHWMAKYYPHIDSKGLHVYVEAAPWHYDYLEMRGFVSSLEQLKNVTPASSQLQKPTTANHGFIGFLDPAKVMGERIGALFGNAPKKYATAVDWYSKVVPRAFNSKQIDAIALHQNAFLGPPLSPRSVTMEELIGGLEDTSESDYGSLLT